MVAVPQIKKPTKKIILPSGYAGGPTIFLRHRLREGNCEDFSFREFCLSNYVIPQASSEKCVQASDPENIALATFRVATSSNPRTISKLSDADVRAVSKIGLALSTCTRETIAKGRPSRLC